MKKIWCFALAAAAAFSLAACGQNGGREESAPPTESAPAMPESPEPSPEAPFSREAVRAWADSPGDFRPAAGEASRPEAGQRQISVRFGEHTVLYALNDGSAADSLYGMLPLTVQVEDYGANEKIFYPEQELDLSDAPPATGGAGTLAYYAPWGDVVFFYGDYRENPSLFELGHAVSGGELVGEMSGTVVIEAVEP